MPRTLNLTSLFALLLIATSSLTGCFVFVEEDVYVDDDDSVYQPPPVVNHAPVFDGNDSWWLCEYDEVRDDYFFEFQAVVDDLDGWTDVEFVDVTIFLADDPDYMIDTFGLVYEGEGVWGGLVWERESDLFCGEAVDVLFEAWDNYGDRSDMLIRY
ncbi:MAG: hypothetical protein KDA24_10370 [Deltaproteobacteria bacterium]|nr:hypothetical protein [Deltaproteobacteria bacterium]